MKSLKFLQLAAYAHSVSSIPGRSNLSILLGIWAECTIAWNGDSRLTCRYYLKKYPRRLACVSYHEKVQKQFNSNDADIKRTQREYYGKSPRELHIPEGKQVCVRRPPPRSRPKGSATRFIRPFNGPYTVTGHVHGRQDLLRLRHREIHLGWALNSKRWKNHYCTKWTFRWSHKLWRSTHNAETVNSSELPTHLTL